MTDALWTAAEAAKATGGEATGDWSVTGISIDTRSLSQGDLFVALQDQRDGHDFLDAAYSEGAGAALVSRPGETRPSLQVEDTLRGLEALGRAARARAEAHCVAVTGSVGKTSVKEMLAQVFRAAGPAHWSERSFNNHWGVPLTLARMPRETTRAVFEIGMSTPGEIAPRSRMTRPQTALITKIAPAHLEGMGTIEAVAEEKANIYAGLISGGRLIYPADDVFARHLMRRGLDHQPSARPFSFGRSEGADVRVTGYETQDGWSTITVNAFGETGRVRLHAVGEHWADNAAAAILAALGTEMTLTEVCDALSGYAPPAGRGTEEALHLADGGKATLIDDAYNANPESMRAAIAAFGARPAVRRLVALGEMGELGPDSPALHARLVDPLKAAGVDKVFAAGEGMKALISALPTTMEGLWFPDRTAMEEVVKKTLTTGDALLIKGSNATGMGVLAERLRRWSGANADAVLGDGPEGPVERG